MAQQKVDNQQKTATVKNGGGARGAKFTGWEKFRNIIAVPLFFFSLYLFVVLISFLLQEGADVSHLDVSIKELLTNPNIKIENAGGKWGAILANWFINKGFGFASFIILYLSVLVSLRLAKVGKFSLAKNFGYGIFFIIWISIALAFSLSYFYKNSPILPGGAYGFLLSQHLNSVIGKFGTFFILFGSLLILIIVAFEDAWGAIIGLLNSKRPVRKEVELITNDPYLLVQPPKTIEKDRSFSKVADDDEVKIVYSEPDEDSIELEMGEVFVEDEPYQVIEKQPFDAPVADHRQMDSEEADVEIEEVDYDPTLDLSRYIFPTIDLLEDRATGNPQVTNDELMANKNKILQTLKNYSIEIEKIRATTGPTVTLYEIVPAPGVRISKIKNLEDDIALSLSALGIRIIAPMPGKGTVGIEVPNNKPEVVSMRSLIASKVFQESDFELPLALGKTISNETFVVDLTKMPHILVAGATGQGKSVGLNAIISSLLYKKHPSQLKFVFIDPKKVELNLYSVIEKHFLAKMEGMEDAIITDVQQVKDTLNSLIIEMERRYDLLKIAQTRNVKEYNVKFISRRLNPNKGHRYLPYIVVVVDEFADLIMTAGKEIELPIARIAQLARAVGIHMIIATQRPSINIITGVIKANFPTRIAFKVASMVDSRTILDTPGANQLIGRGDMLVSIGNVLTRIQCAFVDTPEVEAIANFIGKQPGYPTAWALPEYRSDSTDSPDEVDLKNRDELFDDAARIVVLNQTGSTSSIQRKFSIGYNRAGRIMDQLEAAGIVGVNAGSKAREVLIQDENSLEHILRKLPQ
ncbi:MAG: DNA translocase FtsK 4TM domain-containing protein [Prolixibacteraceae bacterium]|jgi:S-DNA-T family DNA segregation ATPase FtsK/SpoIIIE|nr:DNA translocase FtsK 4TM domain-containing protein [Prolixibacteraceae bacterium]